MGLGKIGREVLEEGVEGLAKWLREAAEGAGHNVDDAGKILNEAAEEAFQRGGDDLARVAREASDGLMIRAGRGELDEALARDIREGLDFSDVAASADERVADSIVTKNLAEADAARSQQALAARQHAAQELRSRMWIGAGALGALAVGAWGATSLVGEDGILNNTLVGLRHSTAAREEARERGDRLNDPNAIAVSAGIPQALNGNLLVVDPETYKQDVMGAVDRSITQIIEFVNDPVEGANFSDITPQQRECIMGSFSGSLDDTLTRQGVPTTLTQGSFNQAFTTAVKEDLGACDIGVHVDGISMSMLSGPQANTDYLMAKTN